MAWRWQHTPSSTTVLGGPSTLVWVEDPPEQEVVFVLEEEFKYNFAVDEEGRVIQFVPIRLKWRCRNCKQPFERIQTFFQCVACGCYVYEVFDPVTNEAIGEVWPRLGRY